MSVELLSDKTNEQRRQENASQESLERLHARFLPIMFWSMVVVALGLASWLVFFKVGLPPDLPQEQAHLINYSHWVNDVAFSPTQPIVARATDDGYINLWWIDGTEPAQLRTLPTGCGSARSIDFSPDGRLLAAGCVSGEIRVWDFGDNASPTPLPIKASSGPVNAVLFVQTNQLVSGSEDSTLTFWQLKETRVKLTDGKERVEWKDESKRTMPNVATAREPENAVTCLAVTPDWSQDNPTNIKYLIAVGRRSGSIDVMYLDGSIRSKLVNEDGDLPHEDWVQGLEFSPDSEALISVCSDGSIRFWGTETGRELSPSEENAEVIRDAHRGPIRGLAVSRFGTYVATAGADRKILLWTWDWRARMVPARPPSLELTATAFPGNKDPQLDGHRWFVRSLAFDPKSDFLASGAADNSLRLWKILHPPPPIFAGVESPFLIVVDKSGSMGATDASGRQHLKMVQDAATKQIDALTIGGQPPFGNVIFYDDQAESVLSGILPIDGATKRKLLDGIAAQLAGGGTNLKQAIESDVNSEISAYSQPVNIWVLTDGQDGTIQELIDNPILLDARVASLNIVHPRFLNGTSKFPFVNLDDPVDILLWELAKKYRGKYLEPSKPERPKF